MAETPKLKLPFRVANNAIAVVEQDSIDELAQCAYAVLATEVGDRIEEPEFGIPSQAHRKNGADHLEIREALEEWEPRITHDDSTGEDEWDNVKQKVRVIISG